MSVESPPRLKHDPELGAILRAGDLADVGPARLAAGGDALKAAVAAGVTSASFATWKILLPLLLLIGAVVVVVRPWHGGGDAARTPAPGVAITAAEDAAPATADAITTAAAIVPEVHPEPAPPPVPMRRPRAEPAPDAVPPEALALAPSELPEQIRLYDEARAAGARREFALGLDRLDELFRRFPSTPLRADAELTRAELLTRANRLDDAAAALGGLAADPAHAGRRGELLRALGDVRRQQGDCAAAVAAYAEARAAGLGPREKHKVDRGMERCDGRP